MKHTIRQTPAGWYVDYTGKSVCGSDGPFASEIDAQRWKARK